MRILLVLVMLLLLPVAAIAQSGNSFTGLPGSSLQLDNFSNGQSIPQHHSGFTGFDSSPSPGLNGTVQSFGTHAFGNWSDGTRSTHQRFGTTQFDTYQQGSRTTHCTSQRFGNQTYTNCQ